MYNPNDAEMLRAELEVCNNVWKHYSDLETEILDAAKWSRHAMTLAQNRIDEIEDILDGADIDNKE